MVAVSGGDLELLLPRWYQYEFLKLMTRPLKPPRQCSMQTAEDIIQSLLGWEKV
jgi:hypothetical protein